MGEAFLDAVSEGRVRSMQNKLMPAEVFVQPGALMLGDAFNMRHPLTGGGMTDALYKVFCRTGEEWNEEMQQACFDYLSLGGMYSRGPISLLGGINPRPFVLVAHFFMVALYGIGRLLRPFPTPKSLLVGVQLLLGACSIILPIIRAEGIVSVFAPFLIRKPRVKEGASASEEAKK